nr:glutathione S-transferase N-terminal domain-containing protein [Chloroflexota bacterium]
MQPDGSQSKSAAATPAPNAVQIFSKAGCPYTRALRRKLEHDGLPYVEYDVLQEPDMLQRMLALNGGQRKVPTIVMGEQVIIGFHGS